jgi:hypothetical protein
MEQQLVTETKPLGIKKRKHLKLKVVALIFMMTTGIYMFFGPGQSFITLNTSQAKWVETNGQKYLDVTAGSYYELGLLEGKYLSAQIFNLKLIMMLLGMQYASQGFSYFQMINLAHLYEPYIPNDYIQEMKGIADAIVGITYEEVLTQNTFLDIVHGIFNPSQSENPIKGVMGCTSFGAINNDGVVIGQNFDFNNIFGSTMSYVKHQITGQPIIFTLRMGGMLCLPSGKNEYNVSTTVNIVHSRVVGNYTIPAAVKTRMAFEQSHTAEEFYSLMMDTNNTVSFNLLIADNTNLIAVQGTPIGHIRSDPTNITMTNTFTATEYQTYLLDETESKDRQEYCELQLINAFSDDELTTTELFTMLGDAPMINRYEDGLLGISTLAFFGASYFGLGSPSEYNRGIVPHNLL